MLQTGAPLIFEFPHWPSPLVWFLDPADVSLVYVSFHLDPSSRSPQSILLTPPALDLGAHCNRFLSLTPHPPHPQPLPSHLLDWTAATSTVLKLHPGGARYLLAPVPPGLWGSAQSFKKFLSLPRQAL